MRSALVPCAARILSSAQAAIYVVCLLLLRRGTGAWRSTRSVRDRPSYGRVSVRPAAAAADSLCTALVFFCSDGHLDLWRASGKTNDGRRLSVEEAFQVGKSLFADRALLGGS